MREQRRLLEIFWIEVSVRRFSFLRHLLLGDAPGIRTAELSLPDQGKSPPGTVAVDSDLRGRPRRNSESDGYPYIVKQ